jgi:hypothetical protein
MQNGSASSLRTCICLFAYKASGLGFLDEFRPLICRCIVLLIALFLAFVILLVE